MPMPSKEVAELCATYLTSNYGRAPLNIVRGSGSRVWDAEGKAYLDMLMGIGVNGLGHCPPRVVEALRKQLGEMLHIHNNFVWEAQPLLAKELVAKTTGIDAPRAFFCNSGSEASEVALKVARLWGKPHGGKWKFITLLEGFHGRTYGAISATGQPGLQKGIEPLLPGFTYVPINDAAALEKAFDAETVGFVAEPVQGEGGINVCAREYLQAARELCDKHGALLMYDEVQCGMGRTGSYFAYQTLGAPAPDVLWLAKALGGGFPIGGMIAKGSVAEVLVPSTHGSTFGGNYLACAAARAVIATIDKDNLLARAKEAGARLLSGLRALQERFPKKVKVARGVGLMAALELTIPAADVVSRCLNAGLLINGTHQTVLRFLPAMTISDAEIDEGLAILGKVLGEV